MRFLIITTILEHFGEDDFGRDGHGHASKSKETLYFSRAKKFFYSILDLVKIENTKLE
jgi:hypothetical protein